MNERQTILTIGGLDPSHHAGITPDAEIIARLGHSPLTLCTCLTAQHSSTCQASMTTDSVLIEQQLTTLLEDVSLDGCKLSLVPNRHIASILTHHLPKNIPLLWDPVLTSTSGMNFIAPDEIHSILTLLLPHITLLTPNLPELDTILHFLSDSPLPTSLPAKIQLLQQHYPQLNLLIKGGHSEDNILIDRLYLASSSNARIFSHEKIPGKHFRGTGCAYASLILCHWLEIGDLEQAVSRAHQAINTLIHHAYPLGKDDTYLKLGFHVLGYK